MSAKISERAFVVLSTQRSGSVMLEQALCSHPDVHCYGELLLGHDGLRARRPPLRVQGHRVLGHVWTATACGGLFRPVGTIRSNLLARPECRVGFRLMYNQQWLGVRRMILGESLPVIHLRRKNSLRQFISREQMRARLRERGFASSHSVTGERFAPIWVDPTKALRFVASAQRMQQAMARKYARVTVLELWYEDILGDTGSLSAETSKELCSALGVVDFELRSRVQKNSGRRLEEVAINANELRAAFSGTEQEWMLRDA